METRFQNEFATSEKASLMTTIHLHLPRNTTDNEDVRELARFVSDALPKVGDEVTTSSGSRYRVVGLSTQ